MPDSIYNRMKQPHIIIRRATEDDIPAIQDIARRTWADTYQNVVSPEEQDKILSRAYSRQSLAASIRKGQSFLVAEELGRISGYVDVDFDGTQFNLHRLYILPSSQRSGLGGKLLSEAVKALVPDFVPPNERWVDSASESSLAPTGIAAGNSSRVDAAATVSGLSSTGVAAGNPPTGDDQGAAATGTPIEARVVLPAPVPIPPGDYRLAATVERDNPKARAFYAKMGFSEDKEENVAIGGVNLPLVHISIRIPVRPLKNNDAPPSKTGCLPPDQTPKGVLHPRG